MEVNEQYMKERTAQVEALCEEDSNFAVALVEAPDFPAFVQVLTTKGINFEEEGMAALYNSIHKAAEADELSEADLGNVSGGLILTGYLAALATWSVICAVSGAFVYGVYKGTRSGKKSCKKG